MKKRFPINTTILKIFLSMTLISTVTVLLLLFITVFGVMTVAYDSYDDDSVSPQRTLREISEHLIIEGRPDADGSANQDSATENASLSGKAPKIALQDGFLFPEEYWCILIGENGDVIWSLEKPDDIPSHYSINDVARMTRWFLNDYPVYVQTEDYGLLVLGTPKNSVGKYNMEFSMDWFTFLPRRILAVFLFDFTVAAFFCCLFGSFLYKKISLLTTGLSELRQEKAVSLPTRGIFKEPFMNINKTSESIVRKNALLAARDKARSNWIAGISHDIRTPLSMVIGYGEQLSEASELSESNRKYAAIITAQGLKIKKLVEDLNLISSLEYDMQPLRKKPVEIAVLLRSVVSDILNQGLPECYEISLDLNCGQAVVSADERLLARAFYNLLQNSIVHNENGCRIQITGSLQKNNVLLIIADNGKGCPEEVLKNLETLPNTAHGLGLPMAYRIIRAHGGSFHAENRGGFVISIGLPGEI